MHLKYVKRNIWLLTGKALYSAMVAVYSGYWGIGIITPARSLPSLAVINNFMMVCNNEAFHDTW